MYIHSVLPEMLIAYIMHYHFDEQLINTSVAKLMCINLIMVRYGMTFEHQ